MAHFVDLHAAHELASEAAAARVEELLNNVEHIEQAIEELIRLLERQ